MDVQLGENIRRLREKRRITQKSLAFELEMDVSTLNRIENGITNSFKPQFFIKLTQHLDCSLDELFGLLPNEYMRKDKEMLYQELIKAKDTRIETLSTRIATLEKYIELPEEKQQINCPLSLFLHLTSWKKNATRNLLLLPAILSDRPTSRSEPH